jgi:hypothetical protein
MKTLTKITCICVLSVILISFACIAQDQSSDQTVVIPYPNKLTENSNILYASTFRAAWTYLKDQIVKEDIRTKIPMTIVKQLNAQPYVPKDQKNYLAMGGFVEEGIIADIDQAMSERFNIKTDLEKYKDTEGGIICYAYFKYNAGFPELFDKLKGHFIHEGVQKSVECFGIRGSDNQSLLDQVSYISLNKNEYIVQLKTTNDETDIILAMLPFDQTLQKTADKVLSVMKDHSLKKISRIDKLIIPKIDLSVTHSYDVLKNKYLANKGYEEYFFIEALQGIDFKMNESGVSAGSSAEIVLEKKGPGPKAFIFNKPFLVLVKNKNSDAYELALWINNFAFLKCFE